MNFLTRRRLRNTGLMLMLLGGVWLWTRAQERQLVSSTFTTGYLLISAVLFLGLYNIRKKLPFLAVGSSTAWLQWHIYVGLGSVGVFALHVGPRWPNGIVDTCLAATYLLTVVSGILGLYFTRAIPKQLSRVGDELVFEQIPAFHRQVRAEAGEVVLGSVSASGATTLADFYTGRLYAFFHRPRGVWYLLRPTTTWRRALMREMQDLRRYLSDAELAACERLFALVRRKDDLDFHEARQRLLKVWLFGHIGLTYALVLLGLVHGLVVHAFSGGLG
jgi:hypothetical protein